jgi:DNA-binding transcriptional regulator YiaG
MKTHRQKLGLSAKDYGLLVGVSALSIYKWEDGKVQPRGSALVKIAAVRQLGKREAARRLEALQQGG